MAGTFLKLTFPFGVDPLEHTWLLTFKLLVTPHVLFTKFDGKLQMLAVDAAVRTNFAGADTEHTFPDRDVIKLEYGPAAARIIEHRPWNECVAAAC
jgi:hypothetical protein